MIQRPSESRAKQFRILAQSEAGQEFVRYLLEQEQQLMRSSMGAAEYVRCRQLQGGALALGAVVDVLTTDTVSPARR